MQTTRRTLLAGGVGLGVTALAGPASAATRATPAAAPAARIVEPFQLGVASGQPDQHSVVLWTRLAPDPLAPDGLGGMPDRPVPVEWQVAEDERFRRIVRRGWEITVRADAHSVHAEVDGLRPGTEYFYRFRAGPETSPVGRTVTAPAPGTLGRPLRMSFASCADYQVGWFTAYGRMAEDQPDLIAFLGDYIYEYGDYGSAVRDQAGGECFTLADYRLRHAQHKTDPDLQRAHAVAPWTVVVDDHDVENGWAADIPEQPDPPFLPRRAAAFQAFYEHLPLRRAQRPVGPDMLLHWRLRWGDLATFHLLDTRQYRDDFACTGTPTTVGADCAERLDPARTILGATQERWLLDALRRSTARWDILGQQVFFNQMDWVNGPGRGFNNEGWDGYVGSRQRVVDGLARYARNAVVLTGDVHSHWAGEVRRDYDDPASPPVGVELVATSITSAGDGLDEYPNTQILLSENPHVKFFNGRRGYVRTVINRDEMRVDFRSLPYVTRPDAPAYTSGAFVIEDRNPRLNPA